MDGLYGGQHFWIANGNKDRDRAYGGAWFGLAWLSSCGCLALPSSALELLYSI